MKKTFYVGGALLLLVAAAAVSLGWAPITPSGWSNFKSAKISDYVLKNMVVGIKQPVLVMLKEQADLSALPTAKAASREERIRLVYDALRNKALATQGNLIAQLEQMKLPYRRFYIANMIVVEEATPEQVKQLSQRADVAKIYGNPVVEVQRPVEEEFFNIRNKVVAQPVGDNIAWFGAQKVWDELKVKGQAIVVAGQDTGVQWDHPALRRQYRGSDSKIVNHDFNWHDSVHKPFIAGTKNRCGYELNTPCDDGDHGSHTMGTVVGSDGDQNWIGVAPEAKWIACRNMDGGNGTPASYIECFEWFLAPYAAGANPLTDGDPSKAPHVINNSWGCPSSEGCTGDEILPSLKAMVAAGIMVVASAGNDGPGCSTIQAPPAQHTGWSLVVGAYDHRAGKIASFSSRGPSKFDGGIGPNVVAPGVNIRSSIPNNKYAQSMWSGTSMAGPHVAGMVALMWSANPKLEGKIRETMDLIIKTAAPKTTTQSCGNVPGSQIPNNTLGFGTANAFDAVQAALKY